MAELGDKRDVALAMIREGLDSHEISSKTGLSVRAVAAIKSHDKMGTYRLATEEAEQVVEALETTFVLERDLQRALRSNIEQLEPGLKITDGGNEQSVPSGRFSRWKNFWQSRGENSNRMRRLVRRAPLNEPKQNPGSGVTM